MLIGLMGYAQSGKDTVAEYLTDELHRFERIAFADTLRECLYALNPIIDQPGHKVTWDLKFLVDDLGWDVVKVQYPTVRGLLQRLGTEVGREILGQDIWVTTAMQKVRDGNYVFTDVRFPNEYHAIHNRGGKLWRIERPGTKPVNAHASETALDGFEADVLLVNDGSIRDLWNEVETCLA